jgi:tRNA dimethylallyltransferase
VVGLCVFIFGPTSAGKTAMSVELALRMGARLGREPVIISADSRQVYRYMDIGTSKTTPSQMRGIRHEMIDVADPIRKFELEEYLAGARAVIDAAELPIVVGGTGVYVNALLEGWVVEGDAAVRAALRKDFPPAMASDAYRTLRRLDRGASGRVHPSNYEAVIGALASLFVRRGAEHAATRPGLLLVDPGARQVDRRIERTLDGQLERGLVREVIELAERYRLHGVPRDRSTNQVLHTHGYREFFDAGKPVHRLSSADVRAVRAAILVHVRAYARRQRAWFRKLPPATRVRDAGEALRVLGTDGIEVGG